jgi:hypothetical protein
MKLGGWHAQQPPAGRSRGAATGRPRGGSRRPRPLPRSARRASSIVASASVLEEPPRILLRPRRFDLGSARLATHSPRPRHPAAFPPALPAPGTGHGLLPGTACHDAASASPATGPSTPGDDSSRILSDIAGRHLAYLSNASQARKRVVGRLQTMGLRVDDSGQDWLMAGRLRGLTCQSSVPLNPSHEGALTYRSTVLRQPCTRQNDDVSSRVQATRDRRLDP